MADKLTTVTIQVEGMTCGQCESRIEKAVGALGGVQEVKASAGISEVWVKYDPARAALGSMYEAIRRAGYEVVGRRGAPVASAAAAPPSLLPPRKRLPAPRSTASWDLVAVVAAVYLIIRYTVGFNFLPAVSQSMGYGLIFVVGLLTSLHCVAMCGGIVLSQGVKRKEDAAADPLRLRASCRLQLALPAQPAVQRRAGHFVHHRRRHRGRSGFPVQPVHGPQGGHARDRRRLHAVPRAAHAGDFPLALAPEDPPAGDRRPQVFRRGARQGTVRGGPAERAHALRAAADHAGVRPGHRELLRRSPVHVPVQPGHRAAAAGLRPGEQPAQRQVQCPHAQGQRRAGPVSGAGHVHSRHQPVRHRPSRAQAGGLLGDRHRGGQAGGRRAGGADQGGVRAVLPADRPGGSARALDPQRDSGRSERLQQSRHHPAVRHPQAAGARGEPDRVHPDAGGDHRLYLLDGHDLQLHQGRPGPHPHRRRRPQAIVSG